MSQEYQVDNIQSRFIKALLWDTYVPTVNIWKKGRPLIKDLTYITKDKYLVRAKKDYTIDDINNPNINHPESALNQEYFEIIEPYVENKFYPGVTTNLKSNSSLYDSETHYMLGQYLRSLRDLHDLDLMPFYNCFDGTVSDKIRVNRVKNNSDVEVDSLISNNELADGLTAYIVPIKFNKPYTIYYNSEVPFRIKPVYYNGVSISPLVDTNKVEIQSVLIRRCSMTAPYVFKPVESFKEGLKSGISNIKNAEDYLCLLIQAPKHPLSTLVVLEEDYLGVALSNFDNVNRVPNIYYGAIEDIYNNLDEDKLNKIIKPFSSLTYANDGNNYAFNDRLLEYLLQSPIIDKDKIRDNIKRIQTYLTSDKALKEFGKKYPYPYKDDIWDVLLRLYIYNLVSNDYVINGKSKTNLDRAYLDINGFVDKDSEFIIDKGKVVGDNLNV